MTITFHKEFEDYCAGWYAYLPEYIAQGGNKEDLAMVSGADTFLDKFMENAFYNPTTEREHGRYELTLQLETRPAENYEVLMKSSEDAFGAWYIDIKTGHILWLCPVTLFVFSEYPSFIYYQVI